MTDTAIIMEADTRGRINISAIDDQGRRVDEEATA